MQGVPTPHPHAQGNQALGMQAIATLIAQTNQNAIVAAQGNSSSTITPALAPTTSALDKDKGKSYSDHKVANILGWCNLTDPGKLPVIWFMYAATKVVRTHHNNIMELLENWSKEKGVKVDRRLFLTERTITEWINLGMNPGSAAPRYASCDRGMTGMVARPMTLEDKEAHQLREQVRAETHSNMTYTEVFQEKLMNTPALVQTYDRLLLNIGTFAGLLWIHFGKACPYYIKTMEMYDVMDMEVVEMLEEKFTPQLCREVMWV